MSPIPGRPLCCVALLLGLLSMTSGGAAGVLPTPFCNSLPRMDWLSAEEVELQLKAQGLQLVRLRMADDKCYAVRVRNAAGKTFDLIIHPVTAEIVRGAGF